MIVPWKRYIFTVNDFYENDRKNGPISKADVHCYFQQPAFIESTKRAALYKRVQTLCIDLDQEEEKLRKDMNRTTRYQINKASRDQLTVRHIEAPTSEDITEFAAFFNPFAEEKGIEPCREYKVKSLRDGSRLVISYVHHENGHKLGGHLYIADGVRSTMLYSCSARFKENNIPPIEIGRANRYLHWQDILFFKENDYHVYDFLGLSFDENNKEEQNINKFKKGFGGRVEINYNSYIPQTKKGMLMLSLLRWKWRNQLELVKKGSENNKTSLKG